MRKLVQSGWVNVVVAAVLMLATLPGRTQGLGLITEPLLKDLQLDRLAYANINLWATLLGAIFCLPAGYLIDRFGLRVVSSTVVLLLGLTVWGMSAVGAGVAMLFALLTLTRGFGQSALSVVSITIVGKSSARKTGPAMGVYSVLFVILLAIAFGVIGNAVNTRGWRFAWEQIASTLVFVIAPMAFLSLRDPPKSEAAGEPQPADLDNADTAGNFSLPQALRTPAFWIFGGATAIFGLVSSGLGLFNEAVLKEHGFERTAYYNFLVVTTLVSLMGQMLCGWLALRWPLRRLMATAMFLYAIPLGLLPFLHSIALLWIIAILIGGAAGIVMVTFFAVWGQAFGRAHLGRIQGMAQILTVIASALGPVLFAKCAEISNGSYSPLLRWLAPAVLLFGIAAWKVSMPRLPETAAQNAFPKPAAG